MIFAHSSLTGHLPILLIATAALIPLFLLGRKHTSPHIQKTQLLWTAGVIATALATLPAVEAAASRSLTGHMMQHLLLWVIAPPLLVAAHPFREATRAGYLRPVGRLLAPFERHQTALAVTAWLALVVTLYGTHLTPLYEQALNRPWVHDAEHAAYLSAAVAFWATVLSRRRSGAGLRVVLAVATTAPIVFLGMILTTTNHALYPTYVDQLGANAALADQQAGGAIMWLGSLVAIFPLLLWLPWRWATNEQQRQEIREKTADNMSLAGRS